MFWIVSTLPLIFISFTPHFFKAFWNRPKRYNWYHRHLPALQLFQLSRRIQVFVYSFGFFHFCWSSKIHKMTSSFFFLLTIRLLFWPGLGHPLVSQSRRVFYWFYFLGRILVCAYIIWQHFLISISCTVPRGSTSPLSCAESWFLLCQFAVFAYYYYYYYYYYFTTWEYFTSA